MKILKEIKTYLIESRGGSSNEESLQRFGKKSPLWSYYFDEDSPFQFLYDKCEELIVKHF